MRLCENNTESLEQGNVDKKPKGGSAFESIVSIKESDEMGRTPGRLPDRGKYAGKEEDHRQNRMMV